MNLSSSGKGRSSFLLGVDPVHDPDQIGGGDYGHNGHVHDAMMIMIINDVCDVMVVIVFWTLNAIFTRSSAAPNGRENTVSGHG